jgi:hypothetical protein
MAEVRGGEIAGSKMQVLKVVYYFYFFFLFLINSKNRVIGGKNAMSYSCLKKALNTNVNHYKAEREIACWLRIKIVSLKYFRVQGL